MRLKPVDFGSTTRAVGEVDSRLSFKLPPASTPVALAQQGQNANLCANRNGYNLGDFSDDLKVHRELHYAKPRYRIQMSA
jgi:hypothetical protein